MRKAFFAGLLVVSLAANLAVAASLAWHLWLHKAVATTGSEASGALRPEEVRLIRNIWPVERRRSMMETRDKILDKKAEILSLIAQNPGDFKALEPVINDLLVLQGNMEKQALERVSQVMAGLPPERRPDLLVFLQTRACMGRGAGCGRGMGQGMGMGPGMRCCPGGPPEGAGSVQTNRQGPVK